MDATTRASALFIAVAVFIAGMYWLRDVLTTFALAIFLWLIIDGSAKAIQKRTRILPRAVSLIVAVIAVGAGAASVVAVVADTAASFAGNSGSYGARLDEHIANVYAALGLEEEPPTFGEVLTQIDLNSYFGDLARALRGAASSGLFVVIYVGFLFAAQASWPAKMRAIFPSRDDRLRAAEVLGRIRGAMEKYLWVQTQMSVLTALCSYGVLLIVGIDNALFWAFVIFLLNYIPTIGSIIATVLTTLFELVQFETLYQPLAVLLGVGFRQFLIGNFLQPRLQGQNLNLATIVVLLGLAVWGAVWGLPGMFLSSPLTVMVMIVLAQFQSTRWIAVILSGDGQPDPGGSRRQRVALPASTPDDVTDG